MHALPPMVAVRYHAFIDQISHSTGASDTVLHIHAGMIILLLVRLVSRRSLGSFIPLSFVALFELGNEVMDRLYFGSWRWPDTTADIVNTLFWPLLLCLAIRFRPILVRVRR